MDAKDRRARELTDKLHFALEALARKYHLNAFRRGDFCVQIGTHEIVFRARVNSWGHGLSLVLTVAQGNQMNSESADADGEIGLKHVANHKHAAAADWTALDRPADWDKAIERAVPLIELLGMPYATGADSDWAGLAWFVEDRIRRSKPDR